MADHDGPVDEPGAAALTRYRARRNGADLFAAYAERRRADRAAVDARLAEIARTVEAGTAPAAFAALNQEAISLRILGELDAVVDDLLTFCRSPGKPDDQLVNLRSALRIGRGHTPEDGQRESRSEQIMAKWIESYLLMEERPTEWIDAHAELKRVAGQGTPTPQKALDALGRAVENLASRVKSDNAIAEQIATELEVSKRTAINHWTALKKAEPWQAEWAARVANSAKSHLARAQQTLRAASKQAKEGSKGAVVPKPGKASAKIRKRLNFGKRAAP